MRDFGAGAKTVGGNEGSKCQYTTRLDTYGCGCSHDCKYCYAKSLLDFRGLWKPDSPAVGDIRKIGREIKKLPKKVVRMGGMTDCFQPIEKIHRITYKTIKILNRYRVPYLIVTKSAMVAEPEYMSILDKELAHVQVTVTTLDDALSMTYEKASKPSDRVDAIKRLQDAGIDVAIRLSPFMPEFMDTAKLPELDIQKAVIEFLRVNGWVQKWFDIDYSKYTLNQGGYKHLPLSVKRELIKSIKGFEQMTVCEDEDTAYRYWRDHFNHNPNDCCNLRV